MGAKIDGKKPQIPPKRDPKEVRAEFIELCDEANEMADRGEKLLMRIALVAFEVQHYRHWLAYTSRKTKKGFHSFDQWLREDCQRHRSRVFPLLRVVKFLPLPSKEVEKIGTQKCVELSKVAKYKPERLSGAMDAVRDNPDLTVKDVRNLVDNALAGQHLEAQRFRRWEFAVPEADVPMIEKALRFAQHEAPLDDPDSETSIGRHMVNLFTEFLDYPGPRKVLEELEKAGILRMMPEIEE